MAKLTTQQRKHMPASEFGLPATRQYPVDDRSHAANAKARAQEEYNKGNLSKAKRDEVFAAANKVLGK
jgi:hypothetical protein